MVFGNNPDKLEAKALDYERRGKMTKALKYREKAQQIRLGTHPMYYSGFPSTGYVTPATTTTYTTTTLTPIPMSGLASNPPNTFMTARTPQRYEQNALKWEQRGNWQKAQKNREKVWRAQNPQYGSQYAAPSFYNSQNKFLGYDVLQGRQPMLIQGVQQPMMQGSGLQQGLGVPMQQGMQQGITHHTMAPVVETHVHPTILEQTVRQERVVEVQPVIHREIEAPEVHIIEKHMYEQVRSTGPNVFTNAPIVEETIRPKIIEEIQPVVHREVPAPFVEHVEQHVTEHITQPTTMVKEVLNDPTIRPAQAAGAPLQQGLNRGPQQRRL